jgi:hypothetical protein
VIIAGTGFVAGATVSFGGVPAAGVTVVSGTTITAQTPAHVSGSVDVVVTNPDSLSGTLVKGFAYTFLADGFDKSGLDTSLWNRTLFTTTSQNTTIPVGDSNNQLVIGPLLKKTGVNYNGVSSISTFDFTGSYSFIQLVQGPATSTQVQAQLSLGSSDKNWYQLGIQGGTLKCVKTISSNSTTLFSTAYNSTNHQFLRIRHDSSTGNVVFETAPNNGGDPGAWTQIYAEAWNSSIALTTIMFEIKAGTIQSESSPGSIIFDSFTAAKF